MKESESNKSSNDEEQVIEAQFNNFIILSAEVKKILSKISLRNTTQNSSLIENALGKVKLYYTCYSNLSNYQEAKKHPDKLIAVKVLLVESVNMKNLVKLLQPNISNCPTESILSIICAMYSCLACNSLSNHKLIMLLEDHVNLSKNSTQHGLLTLLIHNLNLFDNTGHSHLVAAKLKTLSALIKTNPLTIPNLSRSILLNQLFSHLYLIPLKKVNGRSEDNIYQYLNCIWLTLEKGIKDSYEFFKYPEYIFSIFNILRTKKNIHTKQYCCYILSSIFEHSRGFPVKEPHSLFNEITIWLQGEIPGVISYYIELENINYNTIEIYLGSLLHLYTSMCTNNMCAARTVVNHRLIKKIKTALFKEVDDNYHKCWTKNKMLEIAISILMPLVELNFLKEPAPKYLSNCGLDIEFIILLLEDINYYKEQNKMEIFSEEFTSVTCYENELTNIYKMILILQLLLIDYSNFAHFKDNPHNPSTSELFKDSIKYTLQRLKESDLNLGLLYNILLLLVRATRNSETESIIKVLTECDIVNFLLFFLDLFFSKNYVNYFPESRITNKVKMLLLDLLNVCTRCSRANYEKVVWEGGIMKIIDILKFNTDNFLFVGCCLSIINNLYKEYLKEGQERVLEEATEVASDENKTNKEEQFMFYEHGNNSEERSNRAMFIPSEGVEVLNSMKKMLEDIYMFMTS